MIFKSTFMFQKFQNFFHFWQYSTIPERMEAKSRQLVLFGSNKALAIFKDSKFRQLINFSRLGEEEQNRIFNELTVTNLIILILLLEQLGRETENPDKKDYLQALQQAAPDYFKNFIKRLNIPEQYVKIWGKLIDLRSDQYRRDLLVWRGELLNDEKLVEFAADNKFVIFQAITSGLYEHLIRGKIKKADPLYKFLQPYLLFVYQGYLKKI